MSTALALALGLGMLPVVAFGWLVLSGRLQAVVVSGRSMEPALRPGQRVFVLRRRARRGDIVLLDDPKVRGAYVIKRLVAVAGDPAPEGLGVTAGAPVPEGKILLLGDNPAHSIDSRMYGPYDSSDIRGVALGSSRQQMSGMRATISA